MAGRKKSGTQPIFLIGLLALLILYLSQKTTAAPKTRILNDLLNDTKLDANNARFWMAISAHETDGWTSEAFIKGNNAFGMAWVASGGRIGDPRSLAIDAFTYGERSDIFSSVENSVKDLQLYFQRTGWVKVNFDTIDQLVTNMHDKGYFTDSYSNYINDVKAWLKKL